MGTSYTIPCIDGPLDGTERTFDPKDKSTHQFVHENKYYKASYELRRVTVRFPTMYKGMPATIDSRRLAFVCTEQESKE